MRNKLKIKHPEAAPKGENPHPVTYNKAAELDHFDTKNGPWYEDYMARQKGKIALDYPRV